MVAVGSRGDCSGESKAAAGVGVPTGEGMLVAVGVPVGGGVLVAVGEAVGVVVDTAGPACDPDGVDTVPSSNDWPQAASKAARAVAPAPFRKQRRSI